MNFRPRYVTSIGLLGWLCFMLPGSLRANTIIGTDNTSNCIPFNCASELQLPGNHSGYQQVYASTAFTGVTPFNQISFFLGIRGGLDSGTYDINFSYTSQAVGGLSTNLSENIGTGETFFGNYTLGGGAAPATLTFTGTTFTYNPSLGNLLMIVSVSGATDTVPVGFLEEDKSGAVTSRAFTSSFGGSDSNGLVTDFSDVPVVTPEPSTILLFGTGVLIVLMLAARIKRHAPPTLC